MSVENVILLQLESPFADTLGRQFQASHMIKKLMLIKDIAQRNTTAFSAVFRNDLKLRIQIQDFAEVMEFILIKEPVSRGSQI